MKMLVLVVLILSAGALLAQGVTLREGQQVSYKFEPRTWEFTRADGPTITVIVDPAGTITVLEGGQFVGQRYDSCAVAD